jgi:hypothetical protein
MPNLTRRRYPERRDCWHMCYGAIQVGTIARRAGCPVYVDQWEWSCGFCPETEPGKARAEPPLISKPVGMNSRSPGSGYYLRLL